MTAKERATLLRFGKALGRAVAQLISIVTPRTFARWVAEDNEGRQRRAPGRKPGRKPTPGEVQALIVRLAKENDWGYSRVLGELQKLGLTVSRSTVVNVLKESGLGPGPKRGSGTWDAYLKRHWDTLWATDFFTVPVWPVFGRVDVCVLFFLHVGTRRVFIPAITTNPAELCPRRPRSPAQPCAPRLVQDGPGPKRGSGRNQFLLV